MSNPDRRLGDDDYCYLTTNGRISGEPREIEIWFSERAHTVYLLSGGGDRSNWVKNLKLDPEVALRSGRARFSGRARLVCGREEQAMARRLLLAKYLPRQENYRDRWGGDLERWAAAALAIAVDLGGGNSPAPDRR